jgi:hypothetical protein
LKPKRLKARAFIEGVEIPVISAFVATQANTAATAAVQVVPGDAAMDILPRSLIHIFFADFVEGPGDNILIGGSGVEAKKLGLPLDEIEKSRYRNFFFGEIIGYTFAKSKGKRQLVLQCVDLSQYWDACYYFKRGWSYQAQFAGASYKTLSDWMYGTGEIIVEKLFTPPVGHPELKGLVAGLVHLLQAVGGVYRSDVKIKGTNVFFSLAELRLGLSNLIAAPADDTPNKLLKKEGFGSIWKKNIKGLGKEFNFRRAILALQKHIFYEVYPNPCCRLIPGEKADSEDDQATRLADHPKLRFVVSNVQKMIYDIDGHLSNLENSHDAVERGGLGEEGRAEYVKQLVIGLSYMEKRMGQLVKEINAEAAPVMGETSGDSREKSAGLRKVSSKVAKARTKVVDAIEAVRASGPKSQLQKINDDSYKMQAKGGKPLPPGLPGMTLKTPPEPTKTLKGKFPALLPLWGTKHNRKIYKALDKAQGKLRELLGLTVKGKRFGSLVNPPRLANQIFRPDPWFCAPPKCNVIFPDQYTSISYSRSFLNEITRLLLRTNATYEAVGGGSSLMFDNFLYAPHVQGLLKQKEVAYKQAKEVGLGYMVANRDIMDHELYTGIVPHYEKARGLKIFGIRSGKVVAGDKKTRLGYAQRLTNFLFFKYRYSGRVIAINCVFNPYLAPGFPALIIDKTADEPTSKEITKTLEQNEGDLSSIRGMTGTHFLGVIASMTHRITQSSGMTQVQLTYARTQREHVDPIGADKVIAKAEKGVGREGEEPVTERYYVAALPDSAPQTGQRGHFGGVIEGVARMTEPPRRSAPLWNSVERNKKGQVTTNAVDVGVAKKASSYGPEVVSLVGDPEAIVTFSFYSIAEILPRAGKKVIDFPFEDIVRPGWYGNIWTNRIIGGAVYSPLLGTGAITDPIVVKDRERTYAMGPTAAALQESSMSEGAEDFSPKAFSIVISDLEQNSTIENAIDFLVYVYSEIRRGNYDVDEFIRGYTWRPIATMYDMFGSNDLEYDENGVVITGEEGFHSKAFGQFNNLFAFADEDVREILGISRNKKGKYFVGSEEVYITEESVSSRLDVRKQRQDKVLEYVKELENKGILG